ncbi:MAG TPA: MATE family efflux transporter [Mobilitalea sp.]|nr:MATE family efflux transporter [Mobilitalea sp.]
MFSRKDLIKLIIPLIIEQILAVTVGMVDSIMVANVGEAAVSGVSLVDSINQLLIGLFSALATGGAVVSAQLLGQKSEKAACKAGEQLIAAILSLSILLMTIAFLFGNSALNLLYGNVDADVMTNARTYLFYSAMSFPCIAVYNACAALFRTMGNSKVSMIISLIMNIIHVIINATLIFGFGLGVRGAAISTLISRTFAAVTLFLLLRNRKHPIHIGSLRNFHIDFLMIQKILRIGVPNGLENSVFQIGKILVQGIVAGLGTSAITANAIAFTFGNFGTLPGVAIGLALITVVGRCMGACDYEGVKKYTHKLLKYSYLFMTLMNVLIALSLPVFLKLYHLSGDTAHIATQLIIYHCFLSSLIWPASFVLPNALRATNDVKFTMWISMFSMWFWRIAFSYFLAIILHMGVLGIWIAMTIDWAFRSVCFVIRFKKERYKKLSYI